MPFKSEAQRGFMYAKHPKIAKRFEAETPDDAKLPGHVKKMNQGGFSDDWKNDLAGYMDEHFGGNQDQDQAQPMADGGFASGLTKDDLFGPPPPLFAPPRSLDQEPVQEPVFNPKAGLPPAATPIAPSAPVVPPAVPSGPDPALQAYLNQQRERLNKFGPDEQMEMERSIQKQRTGLIPNLANAGAGFADAIMQGVARAGSSNFQSNLQNRTDKTQEGQRQAFESGRTAHQAKMKQEMELESMNPDSILSKSTQRANMPTLRGLGYSTAEISQIPASMMPEALTRRLTLEEIKQKGALAMATLGMAGAELGLKREVATANEANQAAQRKSDEEKAQLQSAEGLQKRPWYQKLIEWVPRFRSPATREMLQRIDADPNNAEALDWIKNNASDPRVPAIIQKLAGQ